MKKTKVIGADIFGVKVNYILYEPAVKSSSYMVFYHGAGEVGPIDGSQLDKVEANGPPKHIKAGHEYPFNVIAVQAQTNFDSMNRYLLEYFTVKYDTKKIFITGLSRGGQATHNMTMNDLGYASKLYVGAMPVAGRPDAYGTADPKTVKDLPMIAVHGDKDTTVSYAQDKDWCDRVNATPGRVNKINFITLPGVGHDSWTYAYSLDPNNPCYKFYHDLLKPDVISDRYDEGFSAGWEAGEESGKQLMKMQAITAVSTL